MYRLYVPASGMRFRPDHNTNNTATQNVSQGQNILGSVIWYATAQDYDPIGNQIGDSWLNVTEIDGKAVNGWVAIVHFGVTYCTVENLDPDPPTEPPTEPPAAGLVEIYVDGVKVYSNAD